MGKIYKRCGYITEMSALATEDTTKKLDLLTELQLNI